MMRRAIFVAAAFLACQPAVASERCGNHHFIEIRILPEGKLLWNNSPIDRQALIKNFKALAAMKNQPNIKISPDRSSYDDVAYILTKAQKIGVGCFGFTGIEKSN